MYRTNNHFSQENYYSFLIKLSSYEDDAIKSALDVYFLTNLYNTKTIYYIIGIAKNYDPKKNNTHPIRKREFGK